MNRYQNIPIKKTTTGTRYYKSVKYPIIPRKDSDIYAITTEGDRYDSLAQQFYSDSSLWWIISITNSERFAQGSLYPPVGIQLRIPTEIQSILNDFKLLNK